MYLYDDLIPGNRVPPFLVVSITSYTNRSTTCCISIVGPSLFKSTSEDDQVSRLVNWQALVPLWDVLNHVSGECNVRLLHDEEQGALQMIATTAIPSGGRLPCTPYHKLRLFGCMNQQSTSCICKGHAVIQCCDSPHFRRERGRLCVSVSLSVSVVVCRGKRGLQMDTMELSALACET